MKRYIFASIGLLLVMLSTSGQTYFYISNERANNGMFLPPVLDSQGTPVADTNFVAELWGSATPDSLAPALTGEPPHRVFARLVSPGHFVGETVVVRDMSLGGEAWLQLRVWDSRLGATYEQVAARGIGGFGESPLFYGKGTRGPFCDPPCVPGDLTGLQSFNVRAMTGVLIREIKRHDTEVIVEWWPGFKQYQLQQTQDLNQPWQNLGPPTSATSSTNAIAHPSQHFRVIGLTEVMLAAR
jgi:hypothetical protein